MRSPTIDETVERERSVMRATSARLAAPRSRSASITRRRLPSRSDASEPLLLELMNGRIHFTFRPICQESG